MTIPFTAKQASESLENGDHLSRSEFHRRYEASGIGHAELVQGVVHLRPRTTLFHGGAVATLVGWLGTWSASRPEIRTPVHSTLLIDLDNELQPDLCVLHGGWCVDRQ